MKEREKEAFIQVDYKLRFSGNLCQKHSLCFLLGLSVKIIKNDKIIIEQLIF
jgi:hypothetical protein